VAHEIYSKAGLPQDSSVVFLNSPTTFKLKFKLSLQERWILKVNKPSLSWTCKLLIFQKQMVTHLTNCLSNHANQHGPCQSMPARRFLSLNNQNQSMPTRSLLSLNNQNIQWPPLLIQPSPLLVLFPGNKNTARREPRNSPCLRLSLPWRKEPRSVGFARS
jgi:hypothetical protein